jgi:hypothetical protein
MPKTKTTVVPIRATEEAKLITSVFAKWMEGVIATAIVSGDPLDLPAKAYIQYGWSHGLIHAARLLAAGVITRDQIEATVSEIYEQVDEHLDAQKKG